MFFFTKRNGKNGRSNNGRTEETAGAPAASPQEQEHDHALRAFGATVQGWPRRLTAAADELGCLSQDTEKEFLSLGMNLQTFSAGCAQSSEHAASLAAMLEGGSGFDAAAFKGLFEEAHAEVESCAQAITGGVEGVGDLLARLEKIMDLREFLKKLSRSITILGTVMRIETARVGESEFAVMTSVVDTLAREIDGHTAEITAISKEVRARLSALSSRMRKGLDAFTTALEANRGHIQAVLRDMDGMAAQAREVCRRIEERLARISPETGSVVAALQHHDISRQQIEHVSDVLNEAAAKIPGYPALPTTEQAALVRWLTDAFAIQTSQLRHVVEETDSSARSISTHLAAVASLARGQAEDVAALLKGDAAGGNRIETIGANLESLSRLLSESRGMITEMVEAVSAVSDHIDKMSGQVRNIEQISESINMLALNTIIKVSRTGESGRGLGVLADEIRKLSVNANERISAGAGLITAVLAASEEFKRSLSEEFGRKLTATDEIVGRTQSAVKGLFEADAVMVGALGVLSEKTAGLESEIRRIAAGIRFGAVTREGLARSIAALEELRGLTPGGLAGAPGGAGLETIRTLTQRYTMQSERKIHETTLAASAAGSPAPGTPERHETAEFDSNVELF